MTNQGYWDGLGGGPKLAPIGDLLYESEYDRGVRDRILADKEKEDREQANFEIQIAEEKRRREENLRMKHEFEIKQKKDEEFKIWSRSQPKQKQVNISPTKAKYIGPQKKPSVPQPQQQKLQIAFRDEKPWEGSTEKVFSNIARGFKKFSWIHWVIIVLWFALLSYLFEFKLK